VSWLNTADYTALQLGLCGVGCLGWLVAYAIVLREIHRHGFVEIPAAAVVADLAWEFVWGFVLADVLAAELGLAFVWGYRIGCLMDVVIFAALLRNGQRQLVTPALAPLLRPGLWFGLTAWTLCLVWFYREGHDNDYGAISGYVLNAQLSALYIPLFLARGSGEHFSRAVAWWKFLGTAVLSVFNVTVPALRESPFYLTLAAVTFVLDATYVWLHHRGLRAPSTP
jgi:hypothetical protein